MPSSESLAFLQLIETYGIPSSSQTSSINALIHRQQEEFKTISLEHERLSRLSEECQGKLSSLKWSIEAHKALFSPWRRVPPEVWAEIFMFATLPFPSGQEAWEARPGSEEMHLEGEQWVIASVCRKWREIALANPSLWSYVSIFHAQHNCSRRHTYDRSDDMQFVSTDHSSVSTGLTKQLERSANATLHVSIYPQCNPSTHEMDVLESLLSPHSHRFRYLDTPYSLLCRMSGPFTLLRSISTDKCKTHSAAEPSEAMECANHLRHLKLGQFSLISPDHTYAFPWRHLETLEIGAVYDFDKFVEAALDDLQNSIVTLKLHLFTSEREAPVAGNFLLSHLKHLWLSGTTQQCDFFITLIDTPSLESFSLYDIMPFDAPHALIGLINRSKCRLRSLVLEASLRFRPTLSTGPKIARKLLSHEGFCWSLEYLDIRGFQGALPFDRPRVPSTTVYHRQLTGMIPKTLSPSEFIFPNLKRLHLSRREVDKGAFIDFVRQACARDDDGKLEHLKLHGQVHVQRRSLMDYGDVRKVLSELEDVGLQTVFTELEADLEY